MVNKTISLTEEIIFKLKDEENASALIEKLLRDYYKFNVKNLEDVNQRLNQIKELRNNEIERKETEIEKLTRVKIQIEKQEQDKQEQEERAKRKKEEWKQSFFNNFRDLTGKEATEDIYSEYLEMWGKGIKGFNIWKFLIEKGLLEDQEEIKSEEVKNG
jgi:hypothetical protein